MEGARAGGWVHTHVTRTATRVAVGARPWVDINVVQYEHTVLYVPDQRRTAVESHWHHITCQ